MNNNSKKENDINIEDYLFAARPPLLFPTYSTILCCGLSLFSHQIDLTA